MAGTEAGVSISQAPPLMTITLVTILPVQEGQEDQAGREGGCRTEHHLQSVLSTNIVGGQIVRGSLRW